MATVNRNVHSGNNIFILIDGQRVGLLQNVEASDDYGPEPASGIGDIHVQEYVPTMARHTLSVSGMAIFTNSLRELGLFPENGDAVLQGLVFDVVTADKLTGQILRRYRGCSYASGSVSIAKHSIVMQQGMFNCLDAGGTGV